MSDAPHPHSPPRAVDRVTPAPTYGWSADGKTPEEIAGDARHTQYRLEADLRALKAKLKARWKVGAAAAAALAALAVFIRRRRR